MNKDQEIKEIETQQRALADRLAKLHKSNREPLPGDVWRDGSGAPMVCTNKGHIYPHSGNSFAWSIGMESTRLGTFNEVYVLRSEADDLRQKLLDWRDSDGDGIQGIGPVWPPELHSYLKKLLKND